MTPTGTLLGQYGRHKFAYMLPPDVKLELEALGVDFRSMLIEGDGEWPCFVLPSGTVILILKDDEGNGPGSIRHGGTVEKH